MVRTAVQRFVAITDAEIFHYKALTDAIPGFIQQMDDKHGSDNWHFIALMLQWSQGQVTHPTAPHAHTQPAHTLTLTHTGHVLVWMQQWSQGHTPAPSP